MEKNVEIIPFQKKHNEIWESLVEGSNNGTIYHTQNFLNYHPRGRFHNFHHLIAIDGRIRVVIPGAVTESEAGKTFVSYPGTSFGGFVVPEDFGLSDADAVIVRFLDYLKSEGFKRIDITPSPVFFSRRQNTHADFILSREGFGFKKREITSLITLNYPDGDILKTFDPACRRRSARPSAKKKLDHRKLYRLPWSLTDNVISWLEPTKECNIYCDGCYSANAKGSHKSLAQVRSDLDMFEKFRQTDAVSMAGGDPLVHPDIVEIVRMIAARGLKPVVNTNGHGLTPSLLRDLKKAGLAGFTFHVDSLQTRPDWKGGTEIELNELRQKYAEQGGRGGRPLLRLQLDGLREDAALRARHPGVGAGATPTRSTWWSSSPSARPSRSATTTSLARRRSTSAG